MHPINTFCLAAIVFLSLPLPLFLSSTLGVCPSLRRPLVPWVWANVIVGSACGLLIIATPFEPFIAVGAASAAFILCGMQMFRQIALLNKSMT